MLNRQPISFSLPRPALKPPTGLAFTLTALLIGIVAVLIRVRFFSIFAATSLTRDEAALALHFIGASFLDMFQPLGASQAAPVGFLLIERAMIGLFGTSEMGFRLFSLITSILILPLYYQFARKLLPPAGVLAGLAIVALASPLLFYGTIFKQYSFDVLITLILLNLAQWALRKNPGNSARITMAAAGSAAVWLSFPSVFVIAGIGFTLIASDLLEGRRRQAIGWIVSMAVCALSFGIAYLVSFRHYSKNDLLLSWWTYAFAPLPPRSVNDLKWYSDNFFELFPSELGIREAGLSAALLLFGAYSLLRDSSRRVTVPLLLAPIFVTLIASGLHKYPFGDRTMLFSNPMLTTLVAAGVAAIWELRQPTVKALVAILVATILLYPTYLNAKYAADPRTLVTADFKPTLDFIAAHRQKDDALYVHWDAEILYEYYVVKRDYRDLASWHPLIGQYFFGIQSRPEKLAFYAKNLAPLGSKGRVWVLVGIAGESEESLLVDLFDKRGKKLAEFQGIGGAAYLYELTPDTTTKTDKPQ
jgi:hypothetical protein